MGKIALWILVGAVVLLLIRLFGSAKKRVDDDDRAAPGGGDRDRDRDRDRDEAGPRGELILACAVCGVHVPSSDALFARGRVFCSAAHRDAGPPPGQDEPR